MTKKRAIVSYDKLDLINKKRLLHAFPDGFSDDMTTIKTPLGETLDALFWETEEVVYLVKLPKPAFKAKNLDDDDEDDDLPNVEDLRADVEEFEKDDEGDSDYDDSEKAEKEED